MFSFWLPWKCCIEAVFRDLPLLGCYLFFELGQLHQSEFRFRCLGEPAVAQDGVKKTCRSVFFLHVLYCKKGKTLRSENSSMFSLMRAS